ncbi:MAG: hypothetical protein NUW02_03720 [Candidatus Campbellbacteria bacterium]|nr:hypothetical protein [Candidatus Campbellbacteria bacterium]
MALLRFIPELVLFGLVSALVSFSSTMYSIATTVWAMRKGWDDLAAEDSVRLEKAFWFVFLWLPLGLPSAILALMSALLAGGFNTFLSANQCDVVSTVLAKMRFKKTAFQIAQAGLLRNPSQHTRALLTMTSLECLPQDYPSKPSAIFIGLAAVEEIAAELVVSGSLYEKKQAGRIFNRIADFLEKEGPNQGMRVAKIREFTRRLNAGLGLDDQLLKHP